MHHVDGSQSSDKRGKKGVQFEGEMYFFTVFVLMETGLMLYSIVVEFSDMSV